DSVLQQLPNSISGKVLMPNGDPAGDVPVMVFWHKPLAKTKTNADGTFKLDLDVEMINADVGEAWPRMAVSSALSEFGPGWEIFGRIKDPDSVTIRLVEDLPVSGKILDQQGRPVVGATVSIQSLHRAEDENLDGFLQANRDQPTRVWLYERDSMFYLSPEAVLKLRGITDQRRPSTTTDQSGAFTFGGFGKERSMLVAIDGPGMMRDTFYIATRPEIDARWKRGQPSQETLNMLDSGASMLSVYPARFHHLAAPALTIQGKLIDATSGAPVVGMKVLANVRGSRASSDATSDENGHYQISGLPLEGRLRVSALNPGTLPYIDARVEMDVTTTNPPNAIDFELDRGAIVTGRITDRRTGEGVAGNVGYLSWPNNPQLSSLHQAYDTFNTMATRPDGTYTIVVPHGPGVFAFIAYNRNQFDSASSADFGFPVRDGGMFSSGNHGLVMAEHFHFLKRIEADIDTDQLVVDASIGRGPVQHIIVSRADGGAIDELDARGIVKNTLSGFRGNQFDILGMKPGEKRVLFLRDGEKKYAGVFEIQSSVIPKNDELTLELEPAAAISGRVTDAAGRPLSRWYVAAVSSGMVDKMRASRSELNQEGLFEFDTTTTDADGYFRLKGLPSSTAIEIAAASIQQNVRPEPKVIKSVTLRPGGQQDLGQLKIER
ncbi:MAG: carboxypeptidase regulatory-like domain-containing protein, partial [Planctomycetales bacterium]|nr:carboxypeptidase regulatory-like domain-containing protein [Planctomycetales bacterium]